MNGIKFDTCSEHRNYGRDKKPDEILEIAVKSESAARAIQQKAIAEAKALKKKG